MLTAFPPTVAEAFPRAGIWAMAAVATVRINARTVSFFILSFPILHVGVI
jgi:hypothetical protein